MGGFQIQQRPWTPTKRRGPIAAEFNGPGPASVNLALIGKKSSESKNGRAPAYSFGAKHNGRVESIGPGPGQYNVTGLSSKGKDTPPSLSLHGRPKDAKIDNLPAPGDYDPIKVIHDSSPKYTFGLKTNIDKPIDTPAPNVYTIKPNKEAPSYTMSGRNKCAIDERVKNPGPGAYNNELIDYQSAYSFGIRHSPWADHY